MFYFLLMCAACYTTILAVTAYHANGSNNVNGAHDGIKVPATVALNNWDFPTNTEAPAKQPELTKIAQNNPTPARLFASQYSYSNKVQLLNQENAAKFLPVG